MEKVVISLEKIDLDYDEEADVLYISFGSRERQRTAWKLKTESYTE